MARTDIVDRSIRIGKELPALHKDVVWRLAEAEVSRDRARAEVGRLKRGALDTKELLLVVEAHRDRLVVLVREVQENSAAEAAMQFDWCENAADELKDIENG